jgi:glycosyltransferase involved in cell wall biosynthesis
VEKIAAIVLTLNEEKRVAECLDSLTWCDEVWVLDSCSTDRTLEICREHSVNIKEHKFEGFSAQRQWALDNLPLSSQWVFFVDADERVPPALANEIRASVGKLSFDGYYISRLQYFWGKVSRYGDFGRDRVLRIYRHKKTHFPLKEVHESAIVDGPLGFLKEPMIHIAREDMADLISKLNHYSTLEALRMYRTHQELYSTDSPSYSKANMIKKSVFRYLPFKPLSRFFYDYVICQGFRDGRLGFILAIADALYVYMSYFKLWELRNGLHSSVRQDKPHTDCT